MVTVKKFNSIKEVQQLQKLACQFPDPIFIHSMDNSIMVDAKSFINLYTLDFSQNVQIVSENEKFHELLKKL
ncbi:MAG: hypothetical protein ACOX7P_08160 [Oscillospiraceae bacterium]|jgi:phosphotransferase system HPr-like phosphotransfer protein